jgi:hypothetical protein
MAPQSVTLEDLFFSFTEGEEHAPAPPPPGESAHAEAARR